jgi:hypothetical protein
VATLDPVGGRFAAEAPSAICVLWELLWGAALSVGPEIIVWQLASWASSAS